MIAIGQHYEVNELVDLVLSGTKAQLTPDSIHAICTCYDYLHEKIKREEKTHIRYKHRFWVFMQY